MTFDTTDNIEQKIDKLTLMMGKLVTEDKGQNKPFQPQVYQLNRGRGQSSGNYRGRFRCNNDYRGLFKIQFKILGIDHHIILIIEAAMATIHEAIKGMDDTTIMEDAVIESNLITEVGVDQLKDKIEIGEMIEVRAIVGPGQALGQVQIEIELGAFNVESMIILHENVQYRLARQTSRETMNKYNCYLT